MEKAIITRNILFLIKVLPFCIYFLLVCCITGFDEDDHIFWPLLIFTLLPIPNFMVQWFLPKKCPPDCDHKFNRQCIYSCYED